MNHGLRFFVTLLVACLLLAGCGPTTIDRLTKEKGANQIPAQDVLTLVKGNTLFLHSYNEDSHLFFESSGRLFGFNTASGKDKGRWDVSDKGELCVRMDKWWYGDLRCFDVFAMSSQEMVYLASSGGVIEFSAQPQQGDEKHLYAQAEASQQQQRKSIRKQQEKKELNRETPSAQTAPRQEATPQVIEERSLEPADAKDTSATVEWMAKDCPGCNLAAADLGKADLVEAKLAGADLHGANLSMANLRRADLRGANLRDAVLAYAHLPGANLQGADLRGAVLKGANLIKADLTGAKLEGADLNEILREGAKGLK